MKKSNFLLGSLIIIVIAIVLFFSRQIFFYQYEPEYYENWYYHSQWNIPNSTRGIGDGELYKFIGYRLVEGENPFNLNYEVPPFGKLLFGLGEKYIGNPYWINILLYLLSIGVLAVLAKDLFKKNKIVLMVLLLFVTTPLVATQLKDTMLDLPLMFLLLTHTFLFIRYISNQKLNYLIASGIFLGLFTGTKIGIYTPLIGILGIIMILVFSKKKIWNSMFYTASVFTGYVFSFVTYFIQHPNPIPWLKLHLKVIKFYLGSNLPVDHLNQWKTIFLNSYQGWWNPGKIIRLNDWSFVLPLGIIAFIFVFILAIKKQKKEWIYISGLTFIFLLINSLMAFWPRYLIPIIPLFVLLIVYSAKKFHFIIILIALLNLPFLIKALTPDTLIETIQGVTTSISTRAQRELYRNLNSPNISEENFINQNRIIWDELGIIKIETKIKDINRSKKDATAKYELKYITKYGEIIQTPSLSFKLVHNKWKLNWKWDYLLNNYDPTKKIIIEKEKILPKDKTLSLKSIYIIPRLMSRTWSESLDSLAILTGQNNMDIDKQIKNVVPDQYPQFIGFLKPNLDLKDNKVTNALKTTGLSIDPPDNFFLPKVITSINQISGYYVKAKIYLEDNQGNKKSVPLQIPN